MGRKWIAALLAVAGITELAGTGWGLVAGAAMVYLIPVPAEVRAVVTGISHRLADLGRWITRGRHQVAMAVMPVALVLVPSGVWMLATVGWALVAFGVMLAGLALLLGWDAKAD